MAFDKFIGDFIMEYHILVKNVVYIGIIIVVFVCISGCIRFGIAIRRRKKGTYPPAASQMDEH